MLTVNCMQKNILQMILSGKARQPGQAVKVLNSEGKVVAHAKPRFPMVICCMVFIIWLNRVEPFFDSCSSSVSF